MLQKLFEPTRIGKMELRNRIVMPPMLTNFANKDGSVSQATINHYAAMARGGVGLIIVEATSPYAFGRGSPLGLSMDRDGLIHGFKRLVEAVHQHGAKVALQMHYSSNPAQQEDARDFTNGTPQAFTTEEVGKLVEGWAMAAMRARKAGFDAVECHCAHGHVFSQFLSRRWNKRSDKYGGDLEGRTRLVREIIQRTKSKLGADYPLLVRINGDDYLPDGVTLDESRIIAGMLQDAGADCIDVSSGTRESRRGRSPSGFEPRGYLAYLANAIKKVVHVPVIAVGRINDPLLAESILCEGRADLIAMGRALISDPELPNKAREGRLDDIRMCIACNHCVDTMSEKRKVVCQVNATFGTDAEYDMAPAKKPKKALVAGGGPAGLEAARVAALRGHKVILYESSNRLGGQLLLAAVPPYKDEIDNLTRFLTGQVAKLGVEVHLGEKVTLDLVSQIKPDVVVLATGASPSMPDIPGAERSNVCLATDVLAGKKALGDIVVIIGGGRIGCETAEFLSSQGNGKKVAVVRLTGKGAVAGDVGPATRGHLLKRLQDSDVRVEEKARAKKITEKGVAITIADNPEFVEADSVVLATAAKPGNELAEQLKRKVAKLYVIGDCVAPRRIVDAIHEGFRVGLTL
ncbi:FAD-dependent oxidoreductase [Chloroflexota bacterium]